MIGRVETLLLNRIKNEGCIHLALVDPERINVNLSSTVTELENNGTSGILIGGSTVKSISQLDKAVKTIRKSSSLPTILFPNGPTGISRFADAIFFMSLLNSKSLEFLIRAQVAGAMAVRAFNLEPIPLGYIVVGNSRTAVSKVGQAEPIPFSKPNLAANYGLAAQYLGMRFIYLEAGSGAQKPVDARMVETVTKTVNIPVIVGGGVRTPMQAEKLAKAGASAIVTGTMLERDGIHKARALLASIRRT